MHEILPQWVTRSHPGLPLHGWCQIAAAENGSGTARRGARAIVWRKVGGLDYQDVALEPVDERLGRIADEESVHAGARKRAQGDDLTADLRSNLLNGVYRMPT